MEKVFKQVNKLSVTFKGGETLVSTGSCSGTAEHDLNEDLRFLSVVLPSYIRDKGKTMLDVDNITIKLDYSYEKS